MENDTVLVTIHYKGSVPSQINLEKIAKAFCEKDIPARIITSQNTGVLFSKTAGKSYITIVGTNYRDSLYRSREILVNLGVGLDTYLIKALHATPASEMR